MRKFTTIVAALLLSVATFAQVPQGFSYQAVVRDAQNALVANQTVDVTLTLKAEIKGLTVQTYTEKHSAKTNANGLLTLVVGQGESSQKFSDFKWNLPEAIYNLEIVTPYGTGTTQLLSVPYALYAEQAGEIDYVKLLSSLKASDLSTILGLAEYLKQADIQELLSTYALKTEIPTDVNLSAYAKTDTIDYYYAKKTDIGAMVDYINDTINYYYAKKSDIPTTVSTFTNDAGYLTAHQSLADYATTAKLNDTLANYAKAADLADVAMSGNYNSLINKPVNVSTFNNDKNYLTQAELNNQIKDFIKVGDAFDGGISLAGYYSKNETDSLVDGLYSGKLTRYENPEIGGEHDYVDLGLPSGTLWATCNLGAKKPFDLGGVFQYGYTDAQEGYTTSNILNYSEFFNEENYTPANGDAAIANWGGNWTIPTKEQYEELLNNCYVVFKSMNLIFYKALKDTDKGVYVDVAQPVELHESYHNYTDEVPHIIFPYYNGYGAGWWTRTIEDEERAYALRIVNREGILQPILSRRFKYNGCEIRPVRTNTSASVATASDISSVKQRISNVSNGMIDKIGDMPMATVNVTVNYIKNSIYHDYGAEQYTTATVSFLGQKFTSGTRTFRVPAYNPVFLSVALSKYENGNNYMTYSVRINGELFDNVFCQYQKAKTVSGSSVSAFTTESIYKVGTTIGDGYSRYSNGELAINPSTGKPYMDVSNFLNGDMKNQIVGPFENDVNTIVIDVYYKDVNN